MKPKKPAVTLTLEIVFKDVEASAQGTENEANFKKLFDYIDVNDEYFLRFSTKYKRIYNVDSFPNN